MDPDLDLSCYDYELPASRIAQRPAPHREEARLLILDRKQGGTRHGTVHELGHWLAPGDLLVMNATQVLPARLRGKKRTGGRAEVLILGPGSESFSFRALVRCSGRLRPGLELELGPEEKTLSALVTRVSGDGEALLQFDGGAQPYEIGEMPLPPYIHREQPDPLDPIRYQTVFARAPGAIAAPTAGLHFTRELLDSLRARGVETAEVVLHVGAGTFRPPSEKDLSTRTLAAESFELPVKTAEALERTRARGGRVLAVGTTTTRVLETQACAGGRVEAGSGETTLLLAPGSPFRVVDGLLTNFHLPRSSLLLLVAAFAGRDRILAAYREALELDYRFYSYGDAMLIL